MGSCLAVLNLIFYFQCSLGQRKYVFGVVLKSICSFVKLNKIGPVVHSYMFVCVVYVSFIFFNHLTHVLET